MKTPATRQQLLHARRYLVLLGLAGALGLEAFVYFDLHHHTSLGSSDAPLSEPEGKSVVCASCASGGARRPCRIRANIKGARMVDTNTDSCSPGISRRTVLALAAGVSVNAATSSVPQKVAATSRTNELVMMDAVTLASVIRSRKVSCVEVMTAYLDHTEKVNPKVNAIVALQERGNLLSQANERDSQLARGESMGPLHGFPHAVKDKPSRVSARPWDPRF
jgi:hypothetical protein